MNKNSIIEIIAGKCKPRGLNIFKTVAASTADAAIKSPIKTGLLQAGAKSVVVIANYGGEMWKALQADIEINHGQYADITDPVDLFSSTAIEAAAEELRRKGIAVYTAYPWRQEAGGYLPFQAWGVSAGMGSMSIVGVVVHPEYGSWNSFRGALILDAEIEPDASLDGFDPCADCKAPCIAACPAGAISKSGCNVQKCLGARLFDSRCECLCSAREACVFGIEHKFHRDEITYHSFTGTQNLRRLIGK